MSRWIVALPLIAVGVLIGDGAALGAGSYGVAGYGVAGEVTSDTQTQSAQPQPAQWVPWRSPPEQPQPVQVPAQVPKSIKAVRDKHKFAHHSKPPDLKAADSKSPPVKAPPPLPPALSSGAVATGKDETVVSRKDEAVSARKDEAAPTGEAAAVLKPRSVSTVRFLAPGAESAAPPEAPQPEVSATETSSDPSAGRVNTENASTLLSVLTRKYLDGKHDDTQESATWWHVLPAPLTAIELLMLFAACGCAAIGLYGLVGLRVRRPEPPIEPSLPPRRGHARQQPASTKDQYSARAERQRRFPHQFGAAIRNQ